MKWCVTPRFGTLDSHPFECTITIVSEKSQLTGVSCNFDPLQSNNKDQFTYVTKEKLEAWREAITSYDPPLVGTAGVDPEFVLAIWDLF